MIEDKAIDIAERKLSGLCMYCGESPPSHKPDCNVSLRGEILTLVADMQRVSNDAIYLRNELNMLKNPPYDPYAHELDEMVKGLKTFADGLANRYSRKKSIGKADGSPF